MVQNLPLPEPSAAALVVRRAYDVSGGPTYSIIGEQDDEVRSFVATLDAAGWRRVDSDPVVAVVSAVDEAARVSGARAVAVRRMDPMLERGWPGWDDAVTELGYVGCLRSDDWYLYAAAAEVTQVGPALSHPATDAERWSDALPTASRRRLVEEIVRWRTAALTRWAERAVAQEGRTNKDLENEVGHVRAELAAMRGTLSWRITAPIRQLQSVRLRSRRS